MSSSDCISSHYCTHPLGQAQRWLLGKGKWPRHSHCPAVVGLTVTRGGSRSTNHLSNEDRFITEVRFQWGTLGICEIWRWVKRAPRKWHLNCDRKEGLDRRWVWAAEWKDRARSLGEEVSAKVLGQETVGDVSKYGNLFGIELQGTTEEVKLVERWWSRGGVLFTSLF